MTEITSKKSQKIMDLDFPLENPNKSAHWENLVHLPNDKILDNLNDLKNHFRKHLKVLSKKSLESRNKEGGRTHFLAVWSCIAGYCESITTHKVPGRRYKIFPLPVDALHRLVSKEFMDIVQKSKENSASKSCNHRDSAKALSDVIWSKVISKPSVRDELHSNSVYVALRGHIDKKTLDCFGATVVTVAGLHMLGFKSFLTLSEDHAYESHYDAVNAVENKINDSNKMKRTTCELAVPGNTKAAQSKRGRDISFTFKDKKDLDPQKSWLYMGKCPIICESTEMAISAVLSNITCLIETKKTTSLVSGALIEVKRELLWILYEAGHLSKFPYAMMELGDCEEYLPSTKGEEWVDISDVQGKVLMIEYLYHKAIATSRTFYANGQVYPYCYAGHYHKDAGKESKNQEYRLAEAIRLYSQASCVASKYVYERGDSMQLVKVITGVGKIILNEILIENRNKKEPRRWRKKENAISTGTWLIAFFDNLLYWEESQRNGSGRTFVEILCSNNECSIGKLMQLFTFEVRNEIFKKVFADEIKENPLQQSGFISQNNLLYFNGPISKRMSKNSLLMRALQKPKVAVGEMELTIPIGTDKTDTNNIRRSRSKRMRRH